MSEPASSIGTTERQLNLLSALLKAREPLEWAQITRISGYGEGEAPRTRQKRFERDLKALEAAGLRITRHKDRLRVAYELDRGACLMPALSLSGEQRLLLFRLGMAYLQGNASGPLQQHLSAALLKLQAGAGGDALPATLPVSMIRRTLHRRPGEEARLACISNALLERRRVAFLYEARGRTRAESRHVAPYALVARRGGWYLVGLDVARGATRTFRLSRIRGSVRMPAGKPGEYEIPAGFDPETSFSAEIFGRGEDAFRDVRIEFDTQVGFIVENEFAGIYEVKARKDGSVTLRLPQAYPDELLRYLGEFAGHWEIKAPAALRKLVVQRLKGLAP